MKRRIQLVSVVLLSLSSALSGQSMPVSAGAPPKYFLLVHQEFQPGKASARQKLEVETAQGFDRLKFPVQWIELDALSGAPGALFLDPLDSYSNLEKSIGLLSDLYQDRPDLARLQENIEETVATSNSAIAMRRDDLIKSDNLDLVRMRFLRIRLFHWKAGHESFAQPAQPSVMYEVREGAATSTFLLMTPMQSLSEADDAMGQREQDVAENNLYMVNPSMSHVSSEFAGGDANFWMPTGAPPPVQGRRMHAFQGSSDQKKKPEK
jgi:hypothetical protein